MPPADHRVTLLGKADCSLCDTARAVLVRLCAELGCALQEIDVATDPELRAEYAERLPVVLVDGAEHGYWRVEVPRLRAALAR